MAQPSITFPASGTLTHKEFFFAHTAAPMIPPEGGMGVSDLEYPTSSFLFFPLDYWERSPRTAWSFPRGKASGYGPRRLSSS